MGFRALRVINEDRVAPGGGFGTHPHRDMEIVTYVLEGALEHRDSLGNGSIIRPGEVQRMSAGTGIRHSEFNASKTDAVHLLQIWILPERAGLPRRLRAARRCRPTCAAACGLIASRDGRDGSVTIHQDAAIYAAQLAAGASAEHALAPGRHAWLQVAQRRRHRQRCRRCTPVTAPRSATSQRLRCGPTTTPRCCCSTSHSNGEQQRGPGRRQQRRIAPARVPGQRVRRTDLAHRYGAGVVRQGGDDLAARIDHGADTGLRGAHEPPPCLDSAQPRHLEMLGRGPGAGGPTVVADG